MNYAILQAVCPDVIRLRSTKRVSSLGRLQAQDPGHRGHHHWAPGSLPSPITHQDCPLAQAGLVLLVRGFDENQLRY